MAGVSGLKRWFMENWWLHIKIVKEDFINRDCSYTVLFTNHLVISPSLLYWSHGAIYTLCQSFPKEACLLLQATKEPIRGCPARSVLRPLCYGVWCGNRGVQANHIFCLLEVYIIYIFSYKLFKNKMPTLNKGWQSFII